ncbi:TonB-dependent receptor, partial [Pseudomonas sp. FW305-3-2-15-E-TSA4]|nr:TonB-dependent receptor [Pseudomonas sp. FW305-3-2-15-E-TSA4]
MRRSAFRPAASTLLITSSAFALLTAAPALAQQQSQADAVDDIVVTGTRVQNRSRLDSVAPVDVVTAETLQQRGSTELATQLAATVPALN